MMTRIASFDDDFRATLQALLRWRRDVRSFRRDDPPPGTLERLISLACLAPSVGLSQPWRFVTVDEPERRRAIREDFAARNAEALGSYQGERATLYASLKLAGLETAPLQLAVFADRSTAQGYGLGRRTMPETIEYSTVLAIYTLWLVARAEGLGCGWVSILDPARVTEILEVPGSWRFIAYLCIGYPETEEDTPLLEREGWETRRSPADFILRR